MADIRQRDVRCVFVRCILSIKEQVHIIRHTYSQMYTIISVTFPFIATKVQYLRTHIAKLACTLYLHKYVICTYVTCGCTDLENSESKHIYLLLIFEVYTSTLYKLWVIQEPSTYRSRRTLHPAYR